MLINILILLLSSVYATDQVLIIGDSISSGHGIRLSDSWPVLLEKHAENQNHDIEVINTSSSGNTTQDGIQLLNDALNRYEPTWTIIALGGNDGLRGLPITTIQQNLKSMIEQALSHQQRVILVAMTLPPNWGPKYIAQFKQIYSNLYDEFPDITLIEFNIDEFIDLMQADGIHPAKAAQSKIMKTIYSALAP